MDIKDTAPAARQVRETGTGVDVLETRLVRAWDQFVNAKQICQASLRLEDGIACGRAFRIFLQEFDRLDAAETGEVVQIRGGAQ